MPKSHGLDNSANPTGTRVQQRIVHPTLGKMHVSVGSRYQSESHEAKTLAEVVVSRLTIEAALGYVREGECPICGKLEIAVLGLHLSQRHGLSSARFRELVGLNRNQPLCSEKHSEACRVRAIERGFVPEPPRIRGPKPPMREQRHRQVIKQAQEHRAAALQAWVASHPEERQRIVEARRGSRSPHGTTARYARGCRCDDCRAANTQAGRDYRAKRKQEGRPIKWKPKKDA